MNLEMQERKSVGDTMWGCPFCGEQNPHVNDQCPCGAMLVVIRSVASEGEEAIEDMREIMEMK